MVQLSRSARRRAPTSSQEAFEFPTTSSPATVVDFAALRAAEVASLPGFALSRLPAPFAIEAQHVGGQRCVFDFGMPHARELTAFVCSEWEALVIGAEADRASAQQFGKYLQRKAELPTKLLEAVHTLGGVAADLGAPRMATKTVMANWGLCIVNVEVS